MLPQLKEGKAIKWERNSNWSMHSSVVNGLTSVKPVKVVCKEQYRMTNENSEGVDALLQTQTMYTELFPRLWTTPLVSYSSAHRWTTHLLWSLFRSIWHHYRFSLGWNTNHQNQNKTTTKRNEVRTTTNKKQRKQTSVKTNKRKRGPLKNFLCLIPWNLGAVNHGELYSCQRTGIDTNQTNSPMNLNPQWNRSGMRKCCP